MLRNMWPLSFMKKAETIIPGFLLNPGAESGNMSGWTQNSGGPAAAINTTGGGFPNPVSGSYYFEAAANAAASEFSQIFNVPSTYHSQVDAGLLAVELSVYHAGDANIGDYGSLILECQDSGGSVLSSWSGPSFKAGTSAAWAQLNAKIAIPANTRKIRVGTSNTRVSGTVIDSYWDDFAVSLTTQLTLWSNSLSTGNRTGTITVTATNITTGGGAPSNLVDGSQADSYWWTNGTGNGTGYITFDLGSSKIVDGFRLYESSRTAHGVWRFEGSPDNSSWTQIGADFTLYGEVAGTVLTDQGGIFIFANTTAYRYYRLRHMSGSRSQAPYIREIEFRVT